MSKKQTLLFQGAHGYRRTGKGGRHRVEVISSRLCSGPMGDPAGRNAVNQVTATCTSHTAFPDRESSLPLKIKFSAHVISMLHLLRIFLSENNVGANRRKD